MELYSKKKFWFTLRLEKGADVVAVVDDDNIPYKNWGKKLLINNKIKTNYYKTNLEAFDPISVTNHNNLWHRGFPLQLLNKRKNFKN